MLKTAYDIEKNKVVLLEIEANENNGGNVDLSDHEQRITTLRNDLDDLGDQVLEMQGTLNGVTQGVSSINGKKGVVLLTGSDIMTSDSDMSTIEDKIAALEATIETLPSSGGSSSNYGIRADYAVQYGILDCPNGLIDYSITNKEIELQAGIVMQLAGSDTKTQIGSKMTYEIEETGKIVLFFTKTVSSEGTTQVGLLEAGDVYYQVEEPENGVTSFLAWWNPNVGKWKFKSNYTGNVWREAIATPIANINANNVGITSVNYIGYRVIDDDIIAQLSDIENLQTQYADLLARVNALEASLEG